MILDCLAKDSTDRPVTGENLAAALGKISFSDPWTSARAAEWWQAHMP